MCTTQCFLAGAALLLAGECFAAGPNRSAPVYVAPAPVYVPTPRQQPVYQPAPPVRQVATPQKQVPQVQPAQRSTNVNPPTNSAAISAVRTPVSSSSVPTSRTMPSPRLPTNPSVATPRPGPAEMPGASPTRISTAPAPSNETEKAAAPPTRISLSPTKMSAAPDVSSSAQSAQPALASPTKASTAAEAQVTQQPTRIKVGNPSPAVTEAVAVVQDIRNGNVGQLPQDIKQTQATTTTYLEGKMTSPNTALYKATDVLDKPAGQAVVKGAQEILNVAPVIGNAVGLAKDVAANPGNLGSDIKQTQTATTNYLATYMAPNSALYKATDVLDKPAVQAVVKGAQGVLNEAPKLPSWLSSVLPQK